MVLLQCMTAAEILGVFGLESSNMIPVSLLPDISIILLQQINGRFCVEQPDEDRHIEEPTPFESKFLQSCCPLLPPHMRLLQGIYGPSNHVTR